MHSPQRPAPFPRRTTPPIFARWRNPPTSRAIRPGTAGRTRHGRRAPRRTGRIRRRPTRRSSGCSIPASKRARPAWAREPGFSRRRTIRSTAARISPPRIARASRRRKAASTKRRSAATSRAVPVPRRSNQSDLANALGYGQGDPNKTLIGPDTGEAPEGRDEISDISEPRREKRQMHRPTPQPVTLGVTASMQALDKLLREGRPEFAASGGTAVWTPHRPPRPEKSEGGVADRAEVRFRAEGRPADGDQGSGRGRQAPRPRPGAARRHRLGQDLHHGQGDRGDAAPGPDPGAEQDAGGAALRRVQELLPRQRGRVFRLLLRLLPAGSLRPAHRHLHREGFLDQRADRPHAPLGDARAARARRRHHRRLGVLHLRHRLGRDLFGDDLRDQDAASGSTSAS